MIHFKNKTGFLTFEALITISIVGFFITPLVVMQVSTLMRVAERSRALQCFFLMKELKHKATRDQKHAQEKFTITTTDPKLTTTELLYTLEPIPKESVLHTIPGLFREKIDALDTTTKKTKHTLVSFIYRPPEPTPEQKEKAP